MTLIIMSMASLLSLILGVGSVLAADRTTDRVRAQGAADAAALAAVAEAAPYGHSDPEGSARRYAQMNGARLVKCLCGPGARQVQVVVTVGDSAAAARAVIEPEAFDLAVASGGLHPDLEAAVGRLIEASAGAVHVVSGFRSETEQASLWSDALRRYGDAEIADDWVARPGSSMHNYGLAVDLGGDIELALSLVDRLDLPMHRPLPNEPWHFELVGSRP